VRSVAAIPSSSSANPESRCHLLRRSLPGPAPPARRDGLNKSWHSRYFRGNAVCRRDAITQPLRHVAGKHDPVRNILHDVKSSGGAHYDLLRPIAERCGESLAGIAILAAIDQDRWFHQRVMPTMPARFFTSEKWVSQLVPSASAVASGLAPPLPTSHLKPFRPTV
jgi:hypothetical protein